jgi:hypothetical protein
MAVQSSPSQQSLEDHLRRGKNGNAKNLIYVSPNTKIGITLTVVTPDLGNFAIWSGSTPT